MKFTDDNQNMHVKKLSFFALILLAGYAYFKSQHGLASHDAELKTLNERADKSVESVDSIATAFANHESNIHVTGQGIVIKLLPDDTEGSKHQKFLVKLASGQTILIAHNIDLAPRINSLQEGASIEFSGDYIWNEKGGVLHWTHHDPNGSGHSGWLRYQGQVYQ